VLIDHRIIWAKQDHVPIFRRRFNRLPIHVDYIIVHGRPYLYDFPPVLRPLSAASSATRSSSAHFLASAFDPNGP